MTPINNPTNGIQSLIRLPNKASKNPENANKTTNPNDAHKPNNKDFNIMLLEIKVFELDVLINFNWYPINAGYIRIPHGLNAATSPEEKVNMTISEFNLFFLLSTISLLFSLLYGY